jgi:hypothetical protein
VSKHEDSIAEKLEDRLFKNLPQTGMQEFMHELGLGVSKGPPKGGWPVFDSVTGERLALPQTFSSLPPSTNGNR